MDTIEEIEKWTKAIDENPNDAEAYKNRGNAYKAQGDYTEAITDYETAIALKPDFSAAYNNRGIAYREQGNYTEAIASYTKAIEVKPDNGGAYYNRGRVYYDTRDYDKAITDYNKAIDLMPDDADAYYNLGIVYHDGKRDYDKAIKNYKEAIKLNTAFAEAYNNLGIAYYDTGNYTEAIISYNKAIELDINDNDAEAYNNRGNAYFKQGNYAKAITDFDKATDLNENYAEAYYNRGNVYKDQGNYTKAIVDYEKAIESGFGYADVYFNRGNTYYDQGNYAEAITDFDKAIELKEKYAEAHYNKGVVYDYLGNHDKAIESFEKFVNLTKNFQTYYLLGLHHAKNRNPYPTELYLRKSFEKNSETVLSYLIDRSDIDDFDNNIILSILDTECNKNFVRTVVNKYGINKDDAVIKTCKKIYIQSLKIMSELHVGDEYREGIDFAHYTSKKTAESLLFPEDDKSDDKSDPSKFRLNSSITANDSMEGKTLFSYLDIKNNDTNREYQSFIGCFTFNAESLNQFRLYGKSDDGKEATGLSLTFSQDFFSTRAKTLEPKAFGNEPNITSLMRSELPPAVKPPKTGEQKITPDYPLYHCVYIDPDTKQVIAIGHKEDYTFYWDEVQKKGGPLSEEDIKTVETETIEKYRKYINDKRKTVTEKLNDLRKLLEDNAVKNRDDLVCDLLINLQYVVKHVAFKEEQECRVIQMAGLGDENIKVDEMRRQYIETRRGDDIIQKIHFAPLADGIDLFKDRIETKGLVNITCNQCSHLPFRTFKK